ncbi:hypothetical protein T265_05849 [Opisthorchis viverrini]|uniref:Uncharacterized protein n=1 Tax=Opisthorchis viverrini TaxID=6198 RepID=A0A074ZMN0_OPIVI|nr:hypothetical protein T265_05849 [Opisthorchis viverrini]KER27017.1 hypothetical protein T265_05849 [Opisthorchis viverrini]
MLVFRYRTLSLGRYNDQKYLKGNLSPKVYGTLYTKGNRSTVTCFRCLAAMLSEGSMRAGMLPGRPSPDRGGRDVGFEPWIFRPYQSSQNVPSFAEIKKINRKDNHSVVTLYRCLAAIPLEGSTRAGILPGCSSLDKGSRETEVVNHRHSGQ